MQLAQQLKAAGLGAFPCRVVWDEDRQKWSKHPVTVDGEAWGVTAHRHPDDPAVAWADCTVLGLPVPEGVVVIDLDTYRPGCSTESAEVLFGGPLPWAEALIQTTIGGGSHYAFRRPEWPVKQTSNVGGPGSGIDTRTGGKGFICSGERYTPCNSFGVLRLAQPNSLPVLPECTRALLEEHTPTVSTSSDLPKGDERDVETVCAALAHIDPTERDMWRDIGFALKHYFHDDAEAGYALWDTWSAGQFWPGGCPASYAPDTQVTQWNSFRAQREGATITVGTLFHAAIVGGWVPPARFDTAAAFGAGAASMVTFNGLIELIMERGSDSRSVEAIMAAIVTSGCNEVQAVLLRNELKASLKQAKLLDKDLSRAIDKKVTPVVPQTAIGLYTKNHTDNAQIFMQNNYPGTALIRLEETWYAFDGKSWVERPDAFIDHQITMAMSGSRPQRSTISGTYSVVASMTHIEGATMNDVPGNLMLFQNGVFDFDTGMLHPHSPKYLTTKIVPYAYNPTATAPRWVLFLNEVFEGDQERIELLQEWFGYMLASSYQYQKIMLLIGPRRSGKGTLGLVLSEMIGEANYSGASLASFAEDDFLDSLRNKTVAFSGDTAKKVSPYKIDSVIERIKKISGNDHVDFKRKYKSRMTCRLPTRITLASNHVPRLFDDSEALSTRLLVLPFPVSFADREDPRLIDALLPEMEGIAIWSLQGLARLLQQDRFTLPEASKNEALYIAESYSPLRAFIDAVCVFGGKEDVLSSIEIYDAYRAWALSEQEDRILTRRVFITAFRDISRGKGCEYGPHRRGLDTVRGFRGIKIGPFESVTQSAFTPVAVK